MDWYRFSLGILRVCFFSFSESKLDNAEILYKYHDCRFFSFYQTVVVWRVTFFRKLWRLHSNSWSHLDSLNYLMEQVSFMLLKWAMQVFLLLLFSLKPLGQNFPACNILYWAWNWVQFFLLHIFKAPNVGKMDFLTSPKSKNYTNVTFVSHRALKINHMSPCLCYVANFCQAGGLLTTATTNSRSRGGEISDKW